MLDLFSGIGGFSLAASWIWGADLEIASFCEIDEFCRGILQKHWPDVPIIGDIREMKGGDYGAIDLLAGGFPCQPFSCAGKQQGRSDDRYLWPEMFRIICEARPRWVLAENVPNLLAIEGGLVFDRVCSDLENEGYEVQPLLIPACGVNAPHKSNRLWVVGHAKGKRREEGRQCEPVGTEKRPSGHGARKVACSDKLNDDGTGHGAGNVCRQRGKAPEVCGRRHVEHSGRERREECDAPGVAATPGYPSRGFDPAPWAGSRWLAGLDGKARRVPQSEIRPLAPRIPGDVARLKATGNAIVPQVAARIMEAIKATDEMIYILDP
jgi:DNA (cytosine-5)-methyltransferase 1